MVDTELSTHPYIAGADKLTALCRDLFKNTPITFFEPYKIFKNDDYCGLMSDAKWADYFLQQGYQNSGIAKFQETHLKGDYTLWSFSDMFNIGDCAQKMRQDCVDFNYGNGITLIERHPAYTQLYYFGARTDDKSSNEFFIENIALLRRFVMYFEAQCRQDKLLSQIYQTQYACRNEIDNLPKQAVIDVDFPIRRTYFQSNNHEFYLTESELKCLVLIVQGFTTKEIGKISNLSPRTVETHLNHAKQKARCVTLGELIQKTLSKLKPFLE